MLLNKDFKILTVTIVKNIHLINDNWIVLANKVEVCPLLILTRNCLIKIHWWMIICQRELILDLYHKLKVKTFNAN